MRPGNVTVYGLQRISFPLLRPLCSSYVLDIVCGSHGILRVVVLAAPVSRLSTFGLGIAAVRFVWFNRWVGSATMLFLSCCTDEEEKGGGEGWRGEEREGGMFRTPYRDGLLEARGAIYWDSKRHTQFHHHPCLCIVTVRYQPHTKYHQKRDKRDKETRGTKETRETRDKRNKRQERQERREGKVSSTSRVVELNI